MEIKKDDGKSDAVDRKLYPKRKERTRMTKLTKPVTIDKRQEFGLVDGFEYVICAANGHTIATVDQKGESGRKMARYIADSINERIMKEVKNDDRN